MAARVGTGATSSADASVASITVTKSMTAGNAGTVFVKWENVVTITTVVDTFGSTWVIDTQTGSDPAGAWLRCSNILTGGSNTITVNFSAGAAFRRAFLDEWSGLDSASQPDVATTQTTGTTSPYSAPVLNSTKSGVAVFGVADFAGLSSIVATGTPPHTLLNTLTDCFACYLISASAQAITGGATATGTTSWKSFEMALKDVVVGTVKQGLALLGVGS